MVRLLSMLTTVVAMCAAQVPGSAGKLPVTRLVTEGVKVPATNGKTSPGITVIRDGASWAETWLSLHAKTSDKAPLPAVDFTQDMIVVVAAGQKPSGGFAVVITGAVEANGVVTVSAELTKPGAGCMTSMMITEPADIARLPRRPGEVKLAMTEKAQPCR